MDDDDYKATLEEMEYLMERAQERNEDQIKKLKALCGELAEALVEFNEHDAYTDAMGDLVDKGRKAAEGAASTEYARIGKSVCNIGGLKEAVAFAHMEAEMLSESYCCASHPRRPVRCQLPLGHDGDHQWGGQTEGLSWPCIERKPSPEAQAVYDAMIAELSTPEGRKGLKDALALAEEASKRFREAGRVNPESLREPFTI